MLSPNKKLSAYANEIKSKLDEIPSLGPDEKLVILFMGLDFD
jgi:hypothetical protein